MKEVGKGKMNKQNVNNIVSEENKQEKQIIIQKKVQT